MKTLFRKTTLLFVLTTVLLTASPFSIAMSTNIAVASVAESSWVCVPQLGSGELVFANPGPGTNLEFSFVPKLDGTVDVSEQVPLVNIPVPEWMKATYPNAIAVHRMSYICKIEVD